MTALRRHMPCIDDDRNTVVFIAEEAIDRGAVPRHGVLSEREAATLTWAARGKTSAEIALILGLTKRTVDFHADNARLKLNAATRMEAAVKATVGQLIEP